MPAPTEEELRVALEAAAQEVGLDFTQEDLEGYRGKTHWGVLVPWDTDASAENIAAGFKNAWEQYQFVEGSVLHFELEPRPVMQMNLVCVYEWVPE